MRNKSGFTLVEIMIVVAIIGLLAAIAIPAFQKARERVRINTFVNDLRIATDAFMMYSATFSAYPPDAIPGVIPAGMNEYLQKMAWTEDTPIGGQWDWDNGQFGFTAGVSVYMPSWGDDKMVLVDEACDDGNLDTGTFRRRSNGYISIIEP